MPSTSRVECNGRATAINRRYVEIDSGFAASPVFEIENEMNKCGIGFQPVLALNCTFLQDKLHFSTHDSGTLSNLRFDQLAKFAREGGKHVSNDRP